MFRSAIARSYVGCCKEFACNVGDLDSVLGLGRSPREENENRLQYSCLENSMDREAWWAPARGVAELDMTEQLTHTHTLVVCLLFNKLPNCFSQWLYHSHQQCMSDPVFPYCWFTNWSPYTEGKEA